MDALEVRRQGDDVVIDVPGSPDDVPFFHRALNYNLESKLPGSAPHPEFEFAKLIRRSVADALRDASPAAVASGN